MVRTAEEFRWSSAAAHLGARDQSGVLVLDFWERGGGAETWRQMHGASDEAGRIELLRRCTYSGRPFGEEEFVERIERRFQRVWRRLGFEKTGGTSVRRWEGRFTCGPAPNSSKRLTWVRRITWKLAHSKPTGCKLVT